MNLETKVLMYSWNHCRVKTIVLGVNEYLKKQRKEVTIIAFIVMPAASSSYNVATLKGQTLNRNLKNAIERSMAKLGERIFNQAIKGEFPKETWFSEEEQISLKRNIFAMKRTDLPPIVTHNMYNDANDLILTKIRSLSMFNRPEDRVKIIYHPEFMDADSPVLGIDYEEFVRGSHLGVFPSYYEPWGYTPAECTVLGIPSVTTNLSGFGCFIEEHVENPADHGVFIIDRRTKSIEGTIVQLTEIITSFCEKSQRQRITLRNRVERLSELLDWRHLGTEYQKAYFMALQRKFKFQ